MNKKFQAFSLIEMLLAILIVSILMTALAPVMTRKMTVDEINKNYNSTPIGTIVAYLGEKPPVGWLLCDGKSFNTTAYPELYKFLKTNKTPDMREVQLIGNKISFKRKFENFINESGIFGNAAMADVVPSVQCWAEFNTTAISRINGVNGLSPRHVGTMNFGTQSIKGYGLSTIEHKNITAPSVSPWFGAPVTDNSWLTGSGGRAWWDWGAAVSYSSLYANGNSAMSFPFSGDNNTLATATPLQIFCNVQRTENFSNFDAKLDQFQSELQNLTTALKEQKSGNVNYIIKAIP